MIKTKFRGISLTGKTWTYGDLVTPSYTNRPYMIKPPTEISIIPTAVDKTTVGMYWKLDKNGTEIYEGDRVRFNQFLFGDEIFEFDTEAIVGRNEDGITLKVTDGPFMRFFNWDSDDNLCIPVALFECLNGETFEVISNVHE